MKQVAIYTTPSCMYCRQAKDFFAQHDIIFKEYNVAADAAKRQEMLDRSGQMSVPVIAIDRTVMVGFNRAKIKEVLGLS
ncbi:MAG: glutaredoxin domain-containing protein [Patescibacteria group bacterium]|jgi:glutaredoxin-like YruB-family protein